MKHDEIRKIGCVCAAIVLALITGATALLGVIIRLVW